MSHKEKYRTRFVVIKVFSSFFELPFNLTNQNTTNLLSLCKAGLTKNCIEKEECGWGEQGSVGQQQKHCKVQNANVELSVVLSWQLHYIITTSAITQNSSVWPKNLMLNSLFM